MDKEKLKNLTPQEVFTPSQPANYTFIEREAVNKRLDRAIKTPGKQIVMYGHSGAGKTTLLKNKLDSKNSKRITTRCVTGMSLSDVVLDGFDQLGIFYIQQKDVTESNKIGGSLGVNYFGLKASVKAESKGDRKAIAKRATELPITPQNLAKFMGEAECYWVIEDFHKIRSEDKELLAQIMKVFMDYSPDYPKLKIIAIGAVNSARQVVQYDPEMRNRISEIEVPLMDKSHLKEILLLGQDLLNLNIPESIIKKIVVYSSGLPAVTHQLGLLLCEVNNLDKRHSSSLAKNIKSDSFELVIEEYLEENSDTLKSAYESAIKVSHQRKFENPDELLRAFLKCEAENVSLHEIKDQLKSKFPNYTSNNLKKYMDELTTPERSEILRYNKNSGMYFFSNPFIKAYTQCAHRSEDKVDLFDKSVLMEDLRETVQKELELAKRAFFEDFETI